MSCIQMENGIGSFFPRVVSYVLDVSFSIYSQPSTYFLISYLLRQLEFSQIINVLFQGCYPHEANSCSAVSL